MKTDFAPKYKNFQQDIEGYLTSIGKREKHYDGSIVFTGYDAALGLMFEKYLERKVLSPLVEHFQRWNWEHSYNDYLLTLTSHLLISKDWPDLKRLWDGVLKKRKKLYNDMWKNKRLQPGKLPESSLQETQKRLIDSLQRIIQFAHELEVDIESKPYLKILERVKARKKA